MGATAGRRCGALGLVTPPIFCALDSAASPSPPTEARAPGADSGISVSSQPALAPRAASCAPSVDVPLAKLLPCVPALGAPAQLEGARLSQRSVRLPGTMLSQLAILSALLLAVAPFGSPPRHGLLMQHGSLWQPDGTMQLDALPLAETLLAQLAATSPSCVRGATGVPSLGRASCTPASSAPAPPPAPSPAHAFCVPAVGIAGMPSAASCAPSSSTLASGATKVPSRGAVSPAPAICAPAVGTADEPCVASYAPGASAPAPQPALDICAPAAATAAATAGAPLWLCSTPQYGSLSQLDG